jgi:hypothetical protein
VAAVVEAAAVEEAVGVAAEAGVEAAEADLEEPGHYGIPTPALTARQDYPNPSWRVLVQAAAAEAAAVADQEALYS